MFDLEKQIADWRRELVAAGIKTPERLEELESHLREEFARLHAVDLPYAERFLLAASKLGEGHALKREFAKVDRQRIINWRENPVSLNILAAWFILAGIHSLTALPTFIRARTLSGNWVFVLLTPLVLLSSCQIIIGAGLLRRRRLSRACALGWARMSLALFLFEAIALVFQHVPNAPMNVSSLGFVVTAQSASSARYFFLGLPLPMVFLPIISLLNLGLLMWAWYFLTRPPVRRLFDSATGHPA